MLAWVQYIYPLSFYHMMLLRGSASLWHYNPWNKQSPNWFNSKGAEALFLGNKRFYNAWLNSFGHWRYFNSNYIHSSFVLFFEEPESVWDEAWINCNEFMIYWEMSERSSNSLQHLVLDFSNLVWQTDLVYCVPASITAGADDDQGTDGKSTGST